MPYLIKTPVSDIRAKTFSFKSQKVMYGGRDIRAGDEIFVFDSENEGGRGLCARGVVESVRHEKRTVPRDVRWTPRLSIEVRRTGLAKRHFGREELKPFRESKDAGPEAELARNFYRQATNKIGGISDEAAALLRTCF